MTLLRTIALSFALGSLALGSLALAGCGGRVHLGGDDAGTSPDGGSGEPCGPTTCGAGTVCCNSSCGICTAPGEGCVAIACTTECANDAECGASERCALPDFECPSFCAIPEGCPDLPRRGVCVPRPVGCDDFVDPVCGCDGETYSNRCEAESRGVAVASLGSCGPAPMCAPQDARGDGPCPAFFGVRWNGTSCEVMGGCGCVGADCDATYPLGGEAQCERDHAGCAPCARMDAQGVGDCEASFGVAWDGASCVALSGCSCAGADCDALYGSLESCQLAHAHCASGGSCVTNGDCDPTSYCHYVVGACAGTGTGLGECRPLPPELPCTFEAPPVCGCDGRTYGCEAAANASGVSVLHDGACPTSGVCAAMDARGDGPCAAFFGYAWDGARCTGLSGCGCVGADCGSTYDTPEACRAAHAGCDLPPGRSCGGFAGATCRPDEFCDFADPHACGGDDGSGTCTDRPLACVDIVDPACGCDGTLYSNPCEAHSAGTDTQSSGTCASPPPSP